MSDCKHEMGLDLNGICFECGGGPRDDDIESARQDAEFRAEKAEAERDELKRRVEEWKR